MRIGGEGATNGATIGYDRGFCFPLCFVPRVEPAPPEHAVKMDHFRDVWILRGKYVAFLLMGEHFRRSPAFSVPESAQRWANQVRQEGEIEA